MPKLDCEDTQKLLDAFADNALDAVTSLAVQEHLDTCAHCRSHWQWNKELTRSLSRLAQATPSADTSLRTRVLESPRRNLFEFLSAPRLRRRLAAAVVFIAVFALGATLVFRTQSSPPAAMDFVRNHSISHEPDDRNSLSTRDPAQAQDWISKRLHGSLVIPKQAPDGFRLAGVRICRTGAAAVAQVIYEKEGQRLSFYLTEQSLASLSGLDHAERHLESPVRTGECEGKPLAVWSQANRSYVLVGDVPPNDLLTLANRLSAQL
jgi:anti-sigma factor RsiW